MLKLVAACKSLQDFNTLQIVRLPFSPPYRVCYCDGPCGYFHPGFPEERWERLLAEDMKDLGEWAVDCLKRPEMGYSEGEGRKRITLRIVEFDCNHSAKVREYEL